VTHKQTLSKKGEGGRQNSHTPEKRTKPVVGGGKVAKLERMERKRIASVRGEM